MKKLFQKIKPFGLYTLTALFLCWEMAIQVSPSVMAVNLMKDLHLDSFNLGILSSLYFYTYALMQIPAGLLLDRFNARRVIAGALFVCITGTFLFSLSHSLYALSLARLLIGAGSAFAFISVLVVTAELFDSKYFSLLTGITQLFACIGGVAGTYCMHRLIQYYNWRITMGVLTLLGILLVIAILFFLIYPSADKSNSYKAKPEKFLFQLKIIKNDLKKLFYNSQNWWLALYSLLMWAPMTGFASLWSVVFLKTLNHLSSKQAALLSSVIWIGLAVSGPLVGIFSEYFKTRKKGLIFLSLLGMISFGLILNKIENIWILSVLLFLSGAACSAQILSFTTVKENNSIHIKGTAISVNNIAVVLSGAFFQPLIGWFLSHHFSCQIALLPILLAYLTAAFIAIFFIKESYQKLK